MRAVLAKILGVSEELVYNIFRWISCILPREERKEVCVCGGGGQNTHTHKTTITTITKNIEMTPTHCFLGILKKINCHSLQYRSHSKHAILDHNHLPGYLEYGKRHLAN